MTVQGESARARRYLLGQTTEEECVAIEQAYVSQEAALDEIAAAEDDLIEEYLTNGLDRTEREHFERAYLSAPHHRVRVETVRRLMARGARPMPIRQPKHGAVSRGPWLALAASLLVVSVLALWLLSRASSRPVDTIAESAPTGTVPTGRPPSEPARVNGSRIFAMTLSPVGVRSAAESQIAAIPSNADVFTLRFEQDADNRALVASRAMVRTASGGEVWQGPITVDNNVPPGTIARIDVPASLVPSDDYLITLYGIDSAGIEREWNQYFLRVRAR